MGGTVYHFNNNLYINLPVGSIVIIRTNIDKVTVSYSMWKLFPTLEPLVTLLDECTLMGIPLQWILFYLHLNGRLMRCFLLIHNQVTMILTIYGNIFIIILFPPNVSICLTGYSFIGILSHLQPKIKIKVIMFPFR